MSDSQPNKPYDHFAQSYFGSINNQSRKQADLSAVYQYVPTMKQSGFIIGNPVAYTNQPYLPPHMQPYSPKREQLSPNHHITGTQSQFRGPYLSQSPTRDKSKSRIITHITYNNPAPPAQTTYFQTNNSRVIPGPSLIHSPPTSPSRPSSSLNFPPNRPSNQLVSRLQYEKKVQQARQWQQKYKKLISSGASNTNSHYYTNNNSQMEQLRVENQKLRDKVRKLEAKQQNMTDQLQSVFISLTNKYRDSALKQCMLLTDRFRLQKKANERY